MNAFKREYFYNDPVDVKRIKNMHFPREPREIGGLKIIGCDESPVAVELYRSKCPAYDEVPFAVYESNDEGVLVDPVATVRRIIFRRRRF